MLKNKAIRVLLVLVLSFITIFGYVNFFHPTIYAASTMPSDGTANLKVVDLYQDYDSLTSDKDNIDFSLLKTQVDAVYIRSFSHANAAISIDTRAVYFANSAQNVNLDYGFYYYYIPTADPADAGVQAQIFYNFIKDFKYSCVPVLDVENNANGLTKTALAASVKSFIDVFSSLSGIDIMIYTYPNFMKNNFDSTFNWSAYLLWIAHYNVSSPMEGISSSWMPENLWCWPNWDMWQYTSSGTLSSIPASSGGWLDLSIATDNILLSPIIYQSHIQDVGWQNWVDNGEASGTVGMARRLEAIKIKLQNIDGGIEYQTHVQDVGWMDWVSDGNLSGTSGMARRLEAIRIRLTGAALEKYDIYYRVHAQNIGWMGWTKNGEAAGTAGYSYRLEAIEIKLVPKGEAAPGTTTQPYLDLYSIPRVDYQTHVQDIGWQGYVSNGAVAGTSGMARRLEAIHIKLANVDGGIEYRTHIQDIGWMNWVADNALSGTSGQAKRMEAIQAHLTGAAAEQFDIYYRVHVQNIGWMGWAKNGESAGSAGFAYRMEAIQVVLVPKGGAAPGLTDRAFVQR